MRHPHRHHHDHHDHHDDDHGRRHGRRRGRRRGGRRGFGPWSWQGRLFERGELPIALLSLLADGPRHGYELMKLLEERTGGLYEASAGSVYPILQQLADQELVTSAEVEGGRRVFTLTDNGKRTLADEAETVAAIWSRAEDDEWTGWEHAMRHEAAEIMRPAFRLMRAAVNAIARSRDADRAEAVRQILQDAHEKIRALDDRQMRV